MPDVRKAKINGKEYEYHVATLGRMRQAAKLEREIALIDPDKMVDDDVVFASLVEKWKEVMAVILVKGSDLDVENASVQDLAEAKRGFFGTATPTR
jgi:hypothetical protein